MPKTTENKTQTQESQKILCRINTKNSIPSYILFKLQKTKEKWKILQEARKKKKTYLQMNLDKNYVEFLTRNYTRKKRGELNMYNFERKKKYQLSILYAEKLSLKR